MLLMLMLSGLVLVLRILTGCMQLLNGCFDALFSFFPDDENILLLCSRSGTQATKPPFDTVHVCHK